MTEKQKKILSVAPTFGYFSDNVITMTVYDYLNYPNLVWLIRQNGLLVQLKMDFI